MRRKPVESLSDRLVRVTRNLNIELDRAIERKDKEEGKEKDYFPVYPLRAPALNLNGVEGLLARRAWNYGGERLLSTGVQHVWNIVNISDEVPTEHNGKGFHAVLMSPHNSYAISPYTRFYDTLSGIVEMRGTIIRHTDGVVRAEWARILNILVPIEMMFPTKNYEYSEPSRGYKSKMVEVETPPKVNKYVINDMYQRYGIMPSIVDDRTTRELMFMATLYNLQMGFTKFRGT